MTFVECLRNKFNEVNREDFATTCAAFACCFIGFELTAFLLSLFLGDTIIAMTFVFAIFAVVAVMATSCTLSYMFVFWITYERKL